MLYNALWYFPVLMAAGGLVTIVSDLRLFQACWKRTIRKRRSSEPQSTPVDLSSVEQGSTQSSMRTRPVAHRTSSERPLSEMSAQRPEGAQQTPEPPRSSTVQSWKVGVCLLVTFFLIFIVVMACRGLFGGHMRAFDLFANLWLAGTIIFGGGPVVVPLLREYIVAPGWVSPRDFLLGLAITQAVRVAPQVIQHVLAHWLIVSIVPRTELQFRC